MDKYEKELLDKIDSGEKLTKHEIEMLVFEFDIETDKGENRRWSRSNTTISELGGRFFSTDWEEGLTEMQDNEFYNQPEEVIKHEYPKTVIITEWKPVKPKKIY